MYEILIIQEIQNQKTNKEASNMSVNTVLGKINADELGAVLPHEHIYIDLTTFFSEPEQLGKKTLSHQKVAMDNLGVLSRHPYAIKDNLIIDDPKVQERELMFYKKAGGATIVDATVKGIGRDPMLLRDISNVVGINIITCTGYYVNSSHPSDMDERSIDQLTDEMVQDITIGIEGTKIKAGVIGEIGISEILYPNEEKILNAAAKAQKSTGLGILVHINPWTTNGIQALKILLDSGVKPNKICICHVDVENRSDYILELLKSGAYVEFDNWGKEYFVNKLDRRPGYDCFKRDTERVALVKKLVDMGYNSRILLSCDVCLKNLLHTYGGWGYDHILTNIVPMMEEFGITDNQIELMIRKNPAEFLDVQ
jgi:phosphotriesterase-related protein